MLSVKFTGKKQKCPNKKEKEKRFLELKDTTFQDDSHFQLPWIERRGDDYPSIGTKTGNKALSHWSQLKNNTV